MQQALCLRLSAHHPKRCGMRNLLILTLIIGIAALALRHPLSPFALAPPPIENVAARFALCPKNANSACVIDGDTFRYKGRRIRMIGIDAPELFPARCAAERQKGEAARTALRDLLNTGAFMMTGDARDKYGRELRTITRNGKDLGMVLADKGLVHASTPFEATPGWCG